MESYCLLDMNSLRPSREAGGTTLTVRTALSEVIACAQVPATTSDAEALFCGLDAALRRAWLVRPTLREPARRVKVALYNPYTAEVSIGAVGVDGRVGDCLAYADESPLSLPAAGTEATLHAERGILLVAGRVLVRVEYELADLSRAYLAHQAR